MQEKCISVIEDFCYPYIDWLYSCSGYDEESKFLHVPNICTLEQFKSYNIFHSEGISQIKSTNTDWKSL